MVGDKPIYQAEEAIQFADKTARKIGPRGDALREELLREMVWKYRR